jgi:5-methylcytosine-specific restriction endonuclease McrA
MTYIEQLQTEEWKRKRKKILSRDKHKCQRCKNKKLLKEFEKGIFKDFCFPNERNTEIKGININGLDKNIFLKAGIKNVYSKYLKENSIIYSRENVSWKNEVVGFRNPTQAEIKIIKDFNNKHLKIISEFTQNNNENHFSKRLENLKNETSSKLKIYENEDKINWIFKSGLHIHHTYYISGKKAWEYKDEALITLCYSCHEKLHRNEFINVYNNEFELIGKYKYCLRCHGAGTFPEFNHIQSGICFRCNGKRYEELITTANTV